MGRLGMWSVWVGMISVGGPGFGSVRCRVRRGGSVMERGTMVDARDEVLLHLNRRWGGNCCNEPFGLSEL